MVDVSRSACINHPVKEAVNRCKQCGAPTCHNCTVTGPTGKFCSENCRATHEAFIRNAQTMSSKAPSMFFVRVRSLIGTLLAIAAVLFAAAVVGTVFYIPVLSELTRTVRNLLGI